MSFLKLMSFEETAASPALSFPDVSRNSSHVVVMVDIDAPGGPANNSFSPFLHWLTPVGSGLKSLPNNQSASDAFASYVGPAPPVGSGPHRYIVLLFTDSATTFHMPASFKDLDPSNLNDRAVFDVEKFADEGGFQLAAASWFTTENSTDVPEVPVAAAPRMAGDVGVGLLGLASFCGLAWGLF